MPETYNKTGTTVTSGAPTAGIAYSGLNKVYVLHNTVDLTDAANDADGTVYQVLAIPANTLVMNVKTKIVTAATGTTVAYDIGDASGANSFDDDIDMKAAAGTWYQSVQNTDAYQAKDSAYFQGKFYTTADTIDATIDSSSTQDGTGPKFTIYALCVDYN